MLERLIGVGGMAAVYQARDERLGRVVALKLLAGDEAVRMRFVREARAVAAVDHPHIIPVYAAGEADGMQFIAMRFVAGGTLQGDHRGERRAAATARGGVHLPGRVRPGRRARRRAWCTATSSRATSSSTSRRGGPEHAYLTDFGIARAMLSAGTLTVAGQFLGTPDYAAPEQVNGQPVDGRADQYALACVAFEMLSGTVPFKREMPIAVLYAHLSTPPPLAQLGPPGPVARRRRSPRQGHGEGLRTTATPPAPTSPTRSATPSALTPTTRPAPSRRRPCRYPARAQRPVQVPPVQYHSPHRPSRSPGPRW